MMYFIKGGKQHVFPTPERCGAVKEKEQLRDNILHDVPECEFCMNWWPDDQRHRIDLLRHGRT